MTSNKFNASLKFLLVHEGGYVNNPKDPGGMTNLGVTKAVFEHWTGYAVTESFMRNLSIKDVTPIYEKYYWTPLHCEEIPSGLSHCVFDFGVNSGVSRAAKLIQRIVGASDDGVIGPGTIKIISSYSNNHSVNDTIDIYQLKRKEYYKSLSTFSTFGRGWLSRVDSVTTEAKALLVRLGGIEPPTSPL